MNLSVRSSCLQAHRFSWLNQSALIMWAASSATARPTRHPRRWLRYTVRATVLVGTWTRLSAHKSCQCRRRFLYGWPRAPFAHLPSGWPVPLLESCLSQTQASSSGLGCNHRRLMGGDQPAIGDCLHYGIPPRQRTAIMLPVKAIWSGVRRVQKSFHATRFSSHAVKPDALNHHMLRTDVFRTLLITQRCLWSARLLPALFSCFPHSPFRRGRRRIAATLPSIPTIRRRTKFIWQKSALALIGLETRLALVLNLDFLRSRRPRFFRA